MNKLIIGAATLALLAPAPVMAQSVFDGAWKIDLSSAQMPKKPDVYLLEKGFYECKTCVPAIKVKADGADHPVTGHPYYDMVAVTVVNDHAIKEIDKKGGKMVGQSSSTISLDGKSLTFEFTDSSNTNGAPVTGKGVETRVAKGPAGAHAISGSWRMASISGMSDNGLKVDYKVVGDMLSMNMLTGQSYSAKMDGTEAPYKGDPGITSVSVKKLGARGFEETDKRGAKVVSVAKVSVAPDGKTMTVAIADKLHGTTMSFKAMKQ